MKIREVKFERRQLGWLCKIVFTFTSARQFTDEYEAAEGFHKWWILAFFAARRQLKAHVRAYGARPGERAANGWAG